MKKLTSLFLAAALASPLAVVASEFEGTVKMKVTETSGNTMPLTFSCKSGLTRIDMEAGGKNVAVIMDNAKQEMTMLMPEQHMYMVHPMQPPAGAPEGKAAPEETSVEKTDVHEKILGYDTTKYVAKTKNTTSEIWVTDQLGTFTGLAPRGGMGMGGPGGPGGRRGRQGGGSEAWENAFRGKEAFPLRVSSKDAAGKETFKLEATAVDKASLPASLFQPPSDYQKFDMGAMMRGMGRP